MKADPATQQLITELAAVHRRFTELSRVVGCLSDLHCIWHTFSASGLTATDFSKFDFTTGAFDTTVHPNLSGASMTFGVLVLGGSNDANQSIIADFDNFNITITQTPLPAALPLFATGLGVLGLLGWRRKRKASAVTSSA